MINKQLHKEKRSLIKFYLFIKNIYRSQKILEILSFIIWDILYKFGWYKKKYLHFNNQEAPLHLNSIHEKKVLENNKYNIDISEDNWSYIFIDAKKDLWGVLYESKTIISKYLDGKIKHIYDFKDTIKGIYISKRNHIFVCSKGKIYKSDDQGVSFNIVLKLSTSKSYFLRDGVTEIPNGDIFIGEYGNILQKNKKWKFVGYIYHSNDHGNTWNTYDFLKKEGVNKHVHIIRWSQTLKGLILSEGDNYKRIWYNLSKNYRTVSSSAKNGWKKVNKYHIQKGGHTAITEINGKIYFGSDYMGGTNFIITTNNMKNFREQVVPNPYRKALFRRMEVIYSSTNQPFIWGNLNFEWNKKIKNLILYSDDGGKSWNKVIEYNGHNIITRIVSKSVNPNNCIYLHLIERETKQSCTLKIKC